MDLLVNGLDLVEIQRRSDLRSGMLGVGGAGSNESSENRTRTSTDGENSRRCSTNLLKS